MKTTQFFTAIILCAAASINLFGQVEIPDNQTIKMGNKNVAVYISNTGKYGQTAGFDLDPGNTLEGIVVENGTSESGGFYADGDYAVIWSPGDQGRLLRIYDEDYMGTTTYERAYLDYNGTLYTVSDERQKENISQITNAVDKLKGIKGVDYFYVTSAAGQKPDEQLARNQNQKKKYLGFLAQDVEQVIPEAVDTDQYGNKFISYSSIIPVLVEACKSQQDLIELQQTKITGQEEALNAIIRELTLLKKEISKLTGKN